MAITGFNKGKCLICKTNCWYLDHSNEGYKCETCSIDGLETKYTDFDWNRINTNSNIYLIIILLIAILLIILVCFLFKSLAN